MNITATRVERPAPSGSALAWAARDTASMIGRNVRTMFRVPQVLVFSLVQPVIFVLMFRYVFGGAIKIPGQSYVDFLMPGIFTQTVTFGAMNTAIGLAEDKSKGLLERLKSLPMSRVAVLGGRVGADTVRNVFVILLMLAIGVLVGFRPNTNIGLVIVGLFLLVLFGMALCWLFALLGLSVANAEAAQAAAFPFLAPLVFASNLFASPSTMPKVLAWWARNQPVSAVANAVRACMVKVPAGTPGVAAGSTTTKVLIALAWSLGLGIVLAVIAVRKYRRE